MKSLLRLRAFVLFLCLSTLALGQSTNATISGQVVDPSGRAIPDADIEILNEATGVPYTNRTNASGIYSVSILPPGQYRVQVSKVGFKTIIKPDVVLNVQSAVAVNFTLPLGAASETVTVEAGTSSINTTDAAVSTVVDRQFVENMPLNGRSLQSLISLSAGVIQTPLSYGSSSGSSGEFSVNGMRTEGNYYTVDGVSANVGGGASSGTYSAGQGGSIPNQTALGTTQSIANIDAVEEFRINTSTYSAEYGRSPGAQIALQTRSGTDEVHGSLFEYFRNDSLDANNWFNDHTRPTTQKTAERQNDFGGTVGGPVLLPRFYDGRKRSFFFFSYEGLRLNVPAPAVTTEVPDLSLRKLAAGPLQTTINGFPLPNGTEVPNAPGLAYFTGSYSLPSQLDAVSVRLDHTFGSKLNIFGRFASSPSTIENRYSSNLAQLVHQKFTTRGVTAGANYSLNSRAVNEARFNYTSTASTYHNEIDSFGGATPASLSTFLSNGEPYSQFAAILEFGTNPGIDLSSFLFGQTQTNIVDTQTISTGHHTLKFGVDYRRNASTNAQNLFFTGIVYYNANQLQANSAGYAFASSSTKTEPIYQNFSTFLQDEWKINQRNTLSTGLRWDLNPPPHNGRGITPPVLNQISNLASAELAPAGTPEWNTYYRGFGPRVGLASQLRNKTGSETVLRSGIGVFLDTGNTLTAVGFGLLGFGARQTYSSFALPVSPSVYDLPTPSTASPYTQTVVGFDRNLKLPYALEWNLSLEQALGSSRSFTLGYVASAGRRLTDASFQNPSAINPNFRLGNGAYVIANQSWSNYSSLQTKFQQRLNRGLQVLASFTWSHSIDNKSSNFVNYQPLLKGDSDFDTRLNFQTAITYDLPSFHTSNIIDQFSKGWSADLRAFSRTSTPVDVYGSTYIAADGSQQYSRPNVISGVPLYLYGSRSAIPGGRRFNPEAFQSIPSTLGNAPRNFVRGFGANEIDFALRRQFEIRDQFRIQFRIEAFNILNHPNFGAIYNSTNYGASQFGMAYNTLNVGLLNQNALYEQGGPRSLQLALKFHF